MTSLAPSALRPASPLLSRRANARRSAGARAAAAGPSASDACVRENISSGEGEGAFSRSPSPTVIPPRDNGDGSSGGGGCVAKARNSLSSPRAGVGRRAALVAAVGGLSFGGVYAGDPVFAAEEEVEEVEGAEAGEAAMDSLQVEREVPAPALVDAAADAVDDDAAFAAAATEQAGEVDDPWEGSYVKPALTVPQYLNKVRTRVTSNRVTE